MHTTQGTTIAFSTGFFAEILSFNTPRVTRPAIESTHMGTTTTRTKEPADLSDTAPMRVRLAFDPGKIPPINSAKEQIVITFKGGDVWRFTGFMSDYGADAQVDNRMEADAEITPCGAITVEVDS
jgi:hypothetical protein